ncbi:TBC1 domain, member 5 [Mortierella claussenii]|nr:TBC1 domain, member 5 [Mortierella claussenii]
METDGSRGHGSTGNVASDRDDSSVQETSRSTTTSASATRRYSMAGVIRSIFHAVLVQDVEHLDHVLSSVSLDINCVRDKEQKTMLMVAATENKHRVLRYLLSLPAINVDLQDDEGETALYHAAAAGSTECVQLLLLAGASASLGNEESITPLIIASYNGFVTICRLLITIGYANVNQQDSTRKSALLLASYAGHVDVMAELMEHGATMDTLDQYGWSSLMLAAYAGKLDACKLLLAQGADPHIKTANGKNARSLSWDAGHKSIATYISRFLARGNNISSSSSGPGSSMSSRTMVQQILPSAPRPPSRRTHSPAPSLPSVPEEELDDAHFSTQRSFSAQNSTISRQSALSPRLQLRRPNSIITAPASPSVDEEEPVSPIPTAIAPTRLVNLFNGSHDIISSELKVDEASAVMISPIQEGATSDTVEEKPIASVLKIDGSNKRTSFAQPAIPTELYSVCRRGLVPRHGSRHIQFCPEEQLENADPSPIPLSHSSISPQPQRPIRRQGCRNSSASERIKEMDMEDALNRRVMRRQRLKKQSRNRFWVTLSSCMTICCPRRMFPKAWGKTRCRYWREKATVGLLLAALSITLGFLAFGLALVTCRPHSVSSITVSDFDALYGNSSQAIKSERLMMIRGAVYDIGEFFLEKRHPSLVKDENPAITLETLLNAYSGKDLSFLFPSRDLTSTCNLFGAANNFGRCSSANGITYNYCHQSQSSLQLLHNYRRNDIRIVYEWEAIRGMGSGGRSLFVYDAAVFDVTDYLAQTMVSTMTDTERLQMEWVRSLVGRDATLAVERRPDHSAISACFHEAFKAGALAGQTSGCLASVVINTAALALLMLMVVMRLVFAFIYRLVFARSPKSGNGKGSSNNTSESISRRDTHMLMLVTCEANDSENRIKSTLDSLALTDNDYDHKILMVIVDDRMESTGELSNASLSCLSFMGPSFVDSVESEKVFELDDMDLEQDCNPLIVDGGPPVGVAPTAGSARVYSGHYVAEMRQIPYILIVRSLLPTKSQSSYGSWNKKRMVIRWLSRICFNQPMTAFEFVLCERVRALNQLGPEVLEMLLIVQVGIVSGRDSISCMADTLRNNTQIIGITGYGIVANNTVNWLTRLQDYENHLTLQFFSAFESIVGMTQCLSSRFSLIRIKSMRSTQHNEIRKHRSVTVVASVHSSGDKAGNDCLEEGQGRSANGSGQANPSPRCSRKGEIGLQYSVPILVHPDVVADFVDHSTRTLQDRSLVLCSGEDRYLTGLLHMTFPDRRIICHPDACYTFIAEIQFWRYLEQQCLLFTSSFHVFWIQMWSSSARSAFCLSVNFLVFLEWLCLIFSSAMTLFIWAVIAIMVVGAVTAVGALYSPPTVLALAFMLCATMLQPVLGVLLGQRVLLTNLAGLCLFLATLPLKHLAIPIYACWRYDELTVRVSNNKVDPDYPCAHKKNGVEAEESPERSSAIGSSDVAVTRAMNHPRILRYWTSLQLARMNTLKGARLKWAEVFEDPNLTLDVLRARAVSQHSNLGIDGIRSVCWKVYLSCLPSLEISSWPFAISSERGRYVELRKKYIRAIGGDDEPEPDLDVNNPLSLAEDSPWQQFFVDSELRKIIKQDVDRTLPDNDYFRSEKVQEQLNDILFIYCKINHDVSYRQGMHELVAHILWVVSSESLDVNAEPGTSSDPTLDVIKSVLNSDYIEHDTFALFSSLMSRAKPWYEFSDERGASRRLKPNLTSHTQLFGRLEAPEPPAGKQTPVIEWSMKIFHHLERVDNELYLHLKSLDIQPQLFGIRWFRLLFGREFPMDDVLTLWDGIFAKDPSLNICIFIGLALLLRIRDELLEEDFAGCLHKLMRYPSVKDVHLFIPQALTLQRSPSATGGIEVIRQNNLLSGKPLPALPSPASEFNQGSHSHQSQVQQPVLSQHLPPSALDAIKPVTDGFVHVTKNVLESKGGAALNKAINDMKKNTQSYIRKANAPAQAPSTPSFPPKFDEAISSSTARLTASTRARDRPPRTHESRAVGSSHSSDTDKQLQLQLGQIVAKALVILESEFTAPSNGKDSAHTNENNHSSKTSSKAALAAISGLEHVRDVLLGFSKDLDPLVIESRMLDANATVSGDTGTWDIIQSTAKQPSTSTAQHDTPTTQVDSTMERKPANAATVTTNSGSSTPDRSGSPLRISSDASSERRGISRTSSHYSYSTPLSGTGGDLETKFDASLRVSTPPAAEQYVPTPPPPVPVPKPFSFDDLIDDTSAESVRSSPPSLPASRASHASAASTSKVKSPRSSLAHSQFSWMLNDDGSDRPGGGGGGGAAAGGMSSSVPNHAAGADILSPSFSAAPGHRMKIDPLAGSVSKRSGSASSITGPGAASLSHQQLRNDDPLRQ